MKVKTCTKFTYGRKKSTYSPVKVTIMNKSIKIVCESFQSMECLRILFDLNKVFPHLIRERIIKCISNSKKLKDNL